ncbi:MAG: M23 family metallopeptidase [Treponema sp.]|nr:M23 family metallopeptidase [Treponema sp.]
MIFNKIKKITAGLFIIINAGFLFAASAKYQAENYSLTLSYNDTLVPGDAIFVRMNIQTPKHKKSKIEFEKKAELKLYKNSKIIEKANFYQIEALDKKRNSNITDLLCGLPLSSWLKDDSYSLKVTFSIAENQTYEFFLPVSFQNKTFKEETIPLNEENSAIKNDTSPERMKQIEKLNDILFTVLSSDVYHLKSFVSPTSSNNYTAYFADRRTYIYANGKTSTNLHFGNDYGIPEASDVYACGDGKVVLSEYRISTGWSIVIEHLPGLYSLYYHLSENLVNEGDFVTGGSLIAKSGSTGLSTGPHLHWEIRLNGEAVRPEFFFTNFAFEEE